MNESLKRAMIFDKSRLSTPNVVQKKKDYVVCEKFFFREKKRKKRRDQLLQTFFS